MRPEFRGSYAGGGVGGYDEDFYGIFTIAFCRVVWFLQSRFFRPSVKHGPETCKSMLVSDLTLGCAT